MLLEIENLNIYVNNEYLLKDFSIQIKKSSFFCIVGESGAGKTLALKALLNILPPQISVAFKKISVFGDNIRTLDDLNKYRGQDIAYIPQNPYTAFNPAYTIGWQIVEAIMLHSSNISKKSAVDKAHKLLQDMKLQDVDRVFNSYPKELSGGMSQRAMIAMMIASKPKLLIADEITSALDYSNKLNIINLLKEYITNNDATVVFITHELDLAIAYAESTVVLKKGVIVDRCDNISNSTNSYTRKLISCMPENLYLEKINNQNR